MRRRFQPSRRIAALALVGAAICFSTTATVLAQESTARGVAANGSAASQQARPLWRELTVAQQQALRPLEAEWPKLDAARKRKWIEFAAKYQKMKPEEQVRAQERMRGWVLMTPESRQKARNNYKLAQKVDPQQRQRAWEEYQNLTPEERQKLEEETLRQQQAKAKSSGRAGRGATPASKQP